MLASTRRVWTFIIFALIASLFPCFANAAEGDRCIAISQAPSLILPVTQPIKLQQSEVRLTFVGHATFLIESAAGVKAATDYNDYVRPAVLPDVATMNRAHTTHYTDFPDPDIKYVLRGWNPNGGPARHDITVGDMRVRNVATNIRDWGGGAIAYGNSIFIFEVAGLCVGHLGHLQHTLTPDQIAQIGQLDVVLVPVDGSYTMDLAGMVEVIKALKSRLILPMHYFNEFTLSRFLERVKNEFPIEISDTATIVVSRATLPPEAKILVLPGY
jgi:L-ascorbate metabolism protein UlaG (beta-lactamase superfamily)